MKIRVGDRKELKAADVDEEHALKTKKRVVFSPDNNWDSHVMRVFTLEEGGKTLPHSHDWPHWVYVLAGRGELVTEEENYKLERDTYVFVPAGIKHNFASRGEGLFEFMCIVPPEGDKFKEEEGEKP